MIPRPYLPFLSMTTNTVPQWTFGDRIRKIRRESGLSQEQFAARIRVTRPQLGAWEANENGPRDVVAVAVAIQHEFGVPAGWVLGMPASEGSDLTGWYAFGYSA